MAILLPVEEAEGNEWGAPEGCMLVSSFCINFCSIPCVISLPFYHVPPLYNILDLSTEQIFTASHAKHYFCQSRRATFLCVVFIFSRSKSCKLSELNGCCGHRGVAICCSADYACPVLSCAINLNTKCFTTVASEAVNCSNISKKLCLCKKTEKEPGFAQKLLPFLSCTRREMLKRQVVQPSSSGSESDVMKR